MANDVRRPILVSILAILYFIGGIFLIIFGVMMLTGGIVLSESDPDTSILALGGVPVIVIGVISLILAGGFWNGWKIMWYLGVIFSILSLIGSIVSVFTGAIPMIVSAVIDALILYYLFRPGVKAFFGV